MKASLCWSMPPSINHSYDSLKAPHLRFIKCYSFVNDYDHIELWRINVLSCRRFCSPTKGLVLDQPNLTNIGKERLHVDTNHGDNQSKVLGKMVKVFNYSYCLLFPLLILLYYDFNFCSSISNCIITYLVSKHSSFALYMT